MLLIERFVGAYGHMYSIVKQYRLGYGSPNVSKHRLSMLPSAEFDDSLYVEKDKSTANSTQVAMEKLMVHSLKHKFDLCFDT